MISQIYNSLHKISQLNTADPKKNPTKLYRSCIIMQKYFIYPFKHTNHAQNTEEGRNRQHINTYI